LPAGGWQPTKPLGFVQFDLEFRSYALHRTNKLEGKKKQQLLLLQLIF